jgi:hypothetical protein
MYRTAAMTTRSKVHKTGTRRVDVAGAADEPAPARRRRSKVQRRKKNPVVRTIVGRDRIDGRAVTYQLEKIKCGKGKCRKWHGPYWYAYWRFGTRKRTLYIGKRLRPANTVRNELEKRRFELERERREAKAAKAK